MKTRVPIRVQAKAVHSFLKRRYPARMRGVNLTEMAPASSQPAITGLFSTKHFKDKTHKATTKKFTCPLAKLFWTRFSDNKKQRTKIFLKSPRVNRGS